MTASGAALDLARRQFGITTIHHFLFVPLTIGLSVVVASLQTVTCTARARAPDGPADLDDRSPELCDRRNAGHGSARERLDGGA